MAHQLHRSPFFRRLSPSNDTGAGPVCVSRGGAGAGGGGRGGGGGEGNGVHTPPVSLSASERFQPSWMEGRGAEGRGGGGGRRGGGFIFHSEVSVCCCCCCCCSLESGKLLSEAFLCAPQLSAAQLRPTDCRQRVPPLQRNFHRRAAR